ncbi:winged helix-turn-helix domain-containing protein [Pseudocolwellia sp. HL-MZ19]|uniref:winged helix-turn-helix domain-containing protein n=1 Tax=Pseudocolwellia sp. HL-MZ19 TaxID=3400846 RepID=UPI003CE965AF
MNFHERILILSDRNGDANKEQPVWSRGLKEEYSGLVYCYSVVDLAKQVMSNSFDLIFIDIQKPSEYLVDVIKYIRKTTRLVIWSIVDDAKESDVVMLLKAGADNCLKRSSSQEVILTQIEVFSRRKQLDRLCVEKNQLQLNSFLLCRDKRELYCHDDLVVTTGIEFELLNMLMTNNGEVVSREDIAKSIFKRNVLYCSQSINMHISNIRRKLRAISNNVTIKSVRGNGYIFVFDF